jgi:hypothetical protein
MKEEPCLEVTHISSTQTVTDWAIRYNVSSRPFTYVITKLAIATVIMCIQSYKRWEGCRCVAQDLWSDCYRVMAGRSCLTTLTGKPTLTIEGPAYSTIGPNGRVTECIHCENARRAARRNPRRRGTW